MPEERAVLVVDASVDLLRYVLYHLVHVVFPVAVVCFELFESFSLKDVQDSGSCKANSRQSAILRTSFLLLQPPVKPFEKKAAFPAAAEYTMNSGAYLSVTPQ